MDLNTLGELKDRLNLSGMGKPAMVGVVAVVLMVTALAGVRLAGTATADGFEVSKEAAQEEAPALAEDPASLFVHVSGSVVSPGLYELAAGARVADAVNAAGGFADDAATGSVNLARTLEDGEQIAVASQSQQPDSPQADGGAGAATPVASSSGLVNINTASAVELTSLPGIGEATAAKIVADRQANGPYKTIEDLKRVSGVGDRKFEALSTLICV